MEYASKGVAGAGLGLGIAGTALGLLNGGAGLLNPAAAASTYNCACSENQFVNRYENSVQLQYERELNAKSAEIASLQSDVKLRDANTYTDQKLLEVYKYFDGEIKRVDSVLANQAVINAQQTGILSCMQGQVAQLYSLTKLVVPNTSVCPGWGNVDVTISSATTTA